MKKGIDLYDAFKKNNSTVWIVSTVSIIVCLGSLFFSYVVYKDSFSRIFAIDTKGELVPLKRLSENEDRIIEAKANLELFVSEYYNLDAFTMKRKRERIYWLIGKEPTKLIKDRANKGYFDEFISYQGLRQSAEILQNTLKITNEEPFRAKFVVRIQRVNGNVKDEYRSTIDLEMENVNRNYPYNPHGFLITKFSENLVKVNAIKDVKEIEQEEKISDATINQNQEQPKNELNE